MFHVGLQTRVFWLRLGVISAPPPDTANGFRSVVASALAVLGIDFTVTTSPPSQPFLFFCSPPGVMV